jgi:hypothetical protein
MRKSILAITILILLVTLSNAAPTSDTNASEVPFSIVNGLIIVDAKIKGDVPVKVVLSTGLQYSIIDVSLMEKYKLQGSFAAEGPVNGVNDRTYSFVNVSAVSVGGSKSKDLSMRDGTMSTVSQAAGQEIFGALGADFFEGQIVQFDFKNKVLRFLDKSPADAKKGKDGGAAAAGSSSVVLRMGEKASNPFMRTFLMPIVGDVTINGKQVKLLLDTGRATSLAFSSSSAKKVGFTLPAENGEPLADKVASLRLGTYEMTDVPAVLYAKGTNAEQSLSKYGVVAGTIFLQSFVTTFDFRNKVVVLERV